MLKPTLFISAFLRRLPLRASNMAVDAGGDGEEGLFGGDETRSFTVDIILRISCRIVIRQRKKEKPTGGRSAENCCDRIESSICQ